MAFWRLVSTTAKQNHYYSAVVNSGVSNPNPNPNPSLCFMSTIIVRWYSPYSSYPSRKKRKPKKKPREKQNALTRPLLPESEQLPLLEKILLRDKRYRFLFKTKEFLSKQPDQVFSCDEARHLYVKLGFGRGRNIRRFLQRHPLVFQMYRQSYDIIWFRFTDAVKPFLEEEKLIMDQMEKVRIDTVRKLLMISPKKMIQFSKIHGGRSLFGFPVDFRDRVINYPQYFKTFVQEDGDMVLELVNWDQKLAVSVLERLFLVDELRVKEAFKFSSKRWGRYGKRGQMTLDFVNPLPLVSPYSDGWALDPRSLDAEKYRLGVIHEFLNLTLEKRATIHQIGAFREELSLDNHTYNMLMEQRQTFYLGGTGMNWSVFLKDAYGEDGVLIHKDPLVLFYEKLREFADKQK